MENGQVGTGIVDGMDDAMWEGRYFCYCGAKMKIDAPPHVVAEAKRIFWREHDGPGHGYCDEKACDAARLRNEQLELEWGKALPGTHEHPQCLGYLEEAK